MGLNELRCASMGISRKAGIKVTENGSGLARYLIEVA